CGSQVARRAHTIANIFRPRGGRGWKSRSRSQEIPRPPKAHKTHALPPSALLRWTPSQSRRRRRRFFSALFTMEATTQERPAPPPPSPSSVQMQLPHAAADPSNPFPTTFVQADTTSFKQVVQILTGTPETAAAAAAGGAAGAPAAKPAPTPTGPKKPAFKLYERRGSMKSLKMLCPLLPAAFAAGGSGGCSGFSPRGFSPRGLEVLSPSMLDFPSLALGSPVTPLPPLPGSREAAAAEDRA
uniref:VQ domain-containing protein n=1 Tax=Aegilops tauschii subsp. strangulata TaxID=200361 RepID=A0A453ED34_AEGTS